MARALKLANDRLSSVMEENTLMKPKAQFYDAVTSSKDAIDIGQAAKVLHFGKGRTTLFRILREQDVLMYDNVPYQEYIDRGYFSVIESSWSGKDGTKHVNHKTVVYQKGLDYIHKPLVKIGQMKEEGRHDVKS